MAIKPILFNTDMVRAILNGMKTQTRRIVKDFDSRTITEVFRPDGSYGKYGTKGWRGMLPDRGDGNTYCIEVRPPCEPGDILWVRETWCSLPVTQAGHIRGHDVYYYRADGDLRPDGWRGNWRHSIHMPKKAARIFLQVKDVRMERLQDITTDQARAEGCDGRCLCPCSGTDGSMCTVERDFSVERFETLWDSAIKKTDLPIYGWYANPWVWVIEFKRCEKPEGWCE